MTQKLLYLSRQDVETVNISMSEIIAALEQMFKEKGKGKVEMPPKPGIHTRPDAFIHAMPAYIPSMQAAGMKWVSGYPGNNQKNLPYISGLLILNDPDNGIPISVMDCTWITAMRTGAATALAAKYLAKSDSCRVGILACGVQGRSNLEALHCLFDIKEVKAYDLKPAVCQDYVEQMGQKLSLNIEAVDHPRKAVENMDIIVSSGPILKRPEPVIQADWLSKGVFACRLDFDSYFAPAAFKAADLIFTDDLKQLDYYRQVGYFSETPAVEFDLGNIVATNKSFRNNQYEKIICINLGLALDDMATAILIYQKAKELGIGTLLEL